MRRLLNFTIILLLPTICWGQQLGFKNLYSGDITGASFVDILWDGEKLITTGQFLTDTASFNALNGLLYMELDTNGNTLLTNIYFHPNAAISSSINNSIVKLVDGRVIVLTQTLYDTVSILAIYEQGLLKDTIYFPKNGFEGTMDHCVELPNGILVTRRIQNYDFDLEGVLMKLDKQGNKIWDQHYGVQNHNIGISEPYVLDENTIILPGYKQYWPTTGPIGNKWTKSWIVAVDSLGHIKWEWESEKNLESGISTRMIRLPNNNWLYATAEFIPKPGQIDDFGSRPKLVCRDSNFNLIWEQYLSVFDDKSTSILDLTPTSDGNFLVIGRWSWYTTTAIHKFSPDGASIWSYYDDCEPLFNCDNAMGGVVEIPSGSVFAAGYTSNYQTNKGFGVLIKLDKNGCIDTLCGGMIGAFETEKVSKIKIYPNPTSDLINIINPIGEQIDLYDISGRKIKVVTISDNKQVIDIQELPKGVYLLKMCEKTLHINYKIIKQ